MYEKIIKTSVEEAKKYFFDTEEVENEELLMNYYILIRSFKYFRLNKNNLEGSISLKGLNYVLNNFFKDYEATAIKIKYGLEDGIYKVNREAAPILKVSQQRIDQIKHKFIAKLEYCEDYIFLFKVYTSFKGEIENLDLSKTLIEIIRNINISKDLFKYVSTYNVLKRFGFDTFNSIFELLTCCKVNYMIIRELGFYGLVDIYSTIYAIKCFIEDNQFHNNVILNNKYIEYKFMQIKDSIYLEAKKRLNISSLCMYDKVCKILNNNNLNTIGDLIRCTEEELKSLQNFGATCLIKINKILENLEIDFEYKMLTKDDIRNLNLSVRSYNALNNFGIKTIDDLRNYSKKDIKSLRNIGNKSCDEILQKLSEIGIVLV